MRECRAYPRWRVLPAAVTGFVASCLPSVADSTMYRISEAVSADDVLQFLVYSHGLAPGATVDIDLGCPTFERGAHGTGAYLMMLTRMQWNQWRSRKNPPMLPTGSADTGRSGGVAALPDSYLVSFWRRELVNRTRVSFSIQAAREDRYYLGLYNVMKRSLVLEGSIRLLNPGGEELGLEFVGIPEVFLGCSVVFFVASMILVAMLSSIWKQMRTLIHWVIGMSFLAKALTMFLAWLARDGIDGTANLSASAWGQWSWELLDKAQDILELMMFLLIALGWKILREHLNMTEIRFAIGVSVISFYLGVFEVFCTSDSTCSGYKLSRYTLHTLCYLVVIVAMNFNMQVVHAQINDAPASLEVGRLYQKFKAYSVFRWVFLAFIGAPTVELFLRVSAMPWEAAWAYVLLQNIRTFLIYVAVMFAFRPTAPLPVVEYVMSSRIGDETDEEFFADAELDVH